MKPFKLIDFDENFRQTYHKNTDWPAGIFEYEITLFDTLSKKQEADLAEWLCYNCNDNFIFAKDIDQIIAGGCSNNLQAWQNNSKFLKQKIVEYRIRLYSKDVMLFRMVWVTE